MDGEIEQSRTPPETRYIGMDFLHNAISTVASEYTVIVLDFL